MNGTGHGIDLIVQTCTVELLGSYDVAVAPTPGHRMMTPEPAPLAGVIQFEGEQLRGQLSLFITSALVQATGGCQGRTPHDEQDWVRELTNQLMGRIKARLQRFGIHIRAGLPGAASRSVPPGHPLGQQDIERLAYRFRSLKGDLFVELVGRFSDVVFDYSLGGEPWNQDMTLF